MQQQRRKVPTVHIAQTAGGIIVISKEKRCVTAVTGAFVEQAVHGREQLPDVFECHRILATQVGLQVGHQEGARYPLARNISQHQRHTSGPQLKEVVIVATYLPSLDAVPRVLERFEWG